MYGCGLELIRYIEKNLEVKADEQWQKVDFNEFTVNYENQMPSQMSQNATFSNLGSWYIKHKDAEWCSQYDKNILTAEEMNKWHGNFSDWDKRGERLKIKGKEVVKDRLVGNFSEKSLYNPSIIVHENVIKTILEQPNELYNYVKSKINQPKVQIQEQPSQAASFSGNKQSFFGSFHQKNKVLSDLLGFATVSIKKGQDKELVDVLFNVENHAKTFSNELSKIAGIQNKQKEIVISVVESQKKFMVTISAAEYNAATDDSCAFEKLVCDVDSQKTGLKS